MNQSFKKKAIVVSLASAFVLTGAGFVGVPGASLVSEAHANAFADTSNVAAISAGVTIPVNATASLASQQIAITESVVGSVFGGSGTIKLKLDNGKWISGTLPTVSVVGVGTGSASVALDTADTTNKTLVVTFTAAGTQTAAGTLKLTAITLDTSAVAVGTAINVSVDASSTLAGLTTGTTTKIATTSSAGVTITNPTTVNKAAAGTNANLPSFSFTEAITGSVGTTAGAVKLTLKNGYTWGTKPTLSVSSNTGDATLTTTDGSATGSSSTVASYKLAVVSSGTAKTTFSFGTVSSGVFVPAGSTADIAVTLTVLDDSQNVIASQDVTLANVVAKGLAATLSQVSGQTGTDVLFTGRNYSASAIAKNTVNVKENVGDAVATGSTVTLTLSGGATWTSDGSTVLTSDPMSVSATTTDGFDVTFGSVSSTNKAQASYAASAGTTSAGDEKWAINALSTVGATAGDLNLTVGSNSADSATALKIATIQDATSASVSGSTATVIPGASSAVALPDIVITESAVGALVNSGSVALRLPTGVTYDATVTPTITVKKADGTTVTGKVGTGFYAANSGGTANAVFGIPVSAQSTTADGALLVTVSGLKVIAGSSAAAGDLKVNVHGTASTAATTATTSSEEAMTNSNSGSKPTSGAVKVGTLVAATNPAYPTVTVSDSTKAVISGIPLTAAGNDQGKPGSIYVAFIFGSQVFFMNSSQEWTAYSGTTPTAYFTGNLSTTNIDVLKTAADLSSLKGGQLVIGYGLGLAGLSNPFDEMLRNSRYNVVYTVQ